MSSRRNIFLVAGARPNFMKVAPLLSRLQRFPRMFATRLIHTGQHYDTDMSDVFFRDLDLPKPDRFLGVGSGSHAEQTGRVMIAFEKVCLEERPDLVIVVGDVNSTMACALTAKKLCIPVAHVEAGLRSRDWTMPEEINRVVTDTVSDLLFTPSRDADENLLLEGIPPHKIHFVGNVMIDSLFASLPKSENRNAIGTIGLKSGNYAVLTLHRPSNVDERKVLAGIVGVLIDVSRELPIVWPLHPRSKKNLERFGMLEALENAIGMKITEPLGYLDMLSLNRHARMIITDSGGIQEEATVLGVPCITLRENTERPVTVEVGCNKVVGSHPDAIRAAVFSALSTNKQNIRTPELWDGKAAERVIDIILSYYS
jgi:UDP-N-acetylglucosamine 2-epimerase (non-hydrolysing)